VTLIKPLIRAGKAAAKETRKNKPFFSAVDKAALELPRPKGTGKEFMTELRKVPGVKPAEIQHRKLERIEALPKMEKADFLKQLEENPPVALDEMQFLEDTPQNRDLLADERFGTSFDELRSSEAEEIEDQMATYSQYRVPGGENYREIVLQMPSFGGQDLETLNYLEAMERREGIPTDYGRENLARLRKKRDEMGNVYRSSHWDGVPNVLAHMRVQDRIVPTYSKEQAEDIGRRIAQGINVQNPSNLGSGSIQMAINKGLVTPEEAAQYADFRGFQGVDTKGARQKILHVEEIQSDWHQAGRKKGYVTGDSQAKIDELTAKQEELKALRKELHNRAGALPDGREDEFMSLMDQANDITPQVMKMQSEIDKLSDLKRTGVPDAPFKKNWHELAMKRLINYAAENGYDSIAITPGIEQAKRYDLSQHINEISYGTNPDGTYSLTAIDKNGKPAINKPNLTQSELEDTVGKDMAKKIVAGQGVEYPAGSVSQGKKSLTGIDLQVGGEGMEGFYDKMLPDYLNTFGKKYGSQVGSIDVEVAPAKKTQQIAAPGIDYFPEDIVDPAKTQTLHTFSITPEMREEVTSQGMPLYQKIGVPLGTGAAGAEMEVPQPAEEVEQTEEPAFAMGGAVYNTNPDMRDGGQIIQGNAFKRGGKVHVTNNVDAMFMDVHDKMFKRK
jgi:hypothetical protein